MPVSEDGGRAEVEGTLEGAEEMVEEGTSSMASSSSSSDDRVSARSMVGAEEFLRTMRSGNTI